MKTLIVMRHAKSDWSTGAVDFDRPLNPRGRASAEALGDWLREKDLAPDAALVSAALRTRQTFAGLALGDVDARMLPELYDAPAAALQRAAAGGTGDRLLVIAHNPGIGDWANALRGDTPSPPDFERYPTGATAIFTLEIEAWSDLPSARARLVDFVIPRRLIAAQAGDSALP